MRACLSFLFAVILSLNSAYAAVVGVCDALEQTQDHAAHFGHHSHEHADDHDHHGALPDGADQAPAASDHHHAHVHPGFSTLLPSSVGVILLEGRSPLVTAATDTFVSAPQLRLDRPPRAARS